MTDKRSGSTPIDEAAVTGLGLAFLALAACLEDSGALDKRALIERLRAEAEPYIEDGKWHGASALLRELSHIIEGDPRDWWKPTPEQMRAMIRLVDDDRR
jgi:hypothetical protein